MNLHKEVELHPALARYASDAAQQGCTYPNLHEHVLALAKQDLLVVVDEPMNKDMEIHPLVRWQYRGSIEEHERKAFLFTKPTDSKGVMYDGAVMDRGWAGGENNVPRFPMVMDEAILPV